MSAWTAFILGWGGCTLFFTVVMALRPRWILGRRKGGVSS